jgi:hypothetical protein
VKDSLMHRIARGLIVPFITAICVLVVGVGPARAGKTAQVEVGFVGVPPPNFQNVLLNVRSVRINPKVDAGPGNARWQGIPVPPGIGNAGQTADLQIDLNASQNLPQLFNTAAVQPGTYKVAELLLDPDNPGTLVPNCPLAPPLGATNDGCISYPIQLAANSSVINVSNASGLISPANGTTTPLILQVAVMINSAPTTPGGAYTVTVTLASPPTNPLEMGTVTGSVNVKTGTGSGTSPLGKVRKLSVTAEAIGTNTAVATVLVKNDKFTLELPAASNSGTLYDLALAGGADTYQALRLPPLYPTGTLTDQVFTPTGSETLGNITGTISDNCVATKPIVGATLQLLIPPDTVTSPLPDFCVNSPDQCITVATANTDNGGNFPLPGTLTVPAAFENVPVTGYDTKKPYVMEITAPGYDPLIVQALPSGSAGGKKGGACQCPSTGTPPYPCTPGTSTTFAACNLALNTGYISGSIPIVAPNPGQTTLVQVFAEDHGTNNIENALASPVNVTSSNPGKVSFTLNVPPSVPTFDLFATTIDTYQGISDPFPGHTFAVLSDVTGPAEPPVPGACSTVSAAFEPSQQIDCVGHGSVTGSVANANLGTTVVLSKQDPASGDFVQITNTQVQNQLPNAGPNNLYSFCAPADTYWLQTVQIPTPEPSVTPSAAPTAEPTGSPTVSVTIPPAPLAGGPSPTPTPAIACPTTCSNPDGTCPGICKTVVQPL